MNARNARFIRAGSVKGCFIMSAAIVQTIAERSDCMYKMGRCYLCGRYTRLEQHHLIGGRNRKHSDEYGLIIDVCSDCHTAAPGAIHRNPKLQRELKELGQKMFEETHTREEFMQIFGRNYL
jgi:hypothetical protein